MKRIILLLLVLAITITSYAQVITTFAGNGAAGYSGDGSIATSAELFQPGGIAFDDSGNVYISDTYNNVIRKVSSSGIISTYAGNGAAGYSGDGGPATSAELSNPLKMAFDKQRNLFVADYGNNVIRKISPSGIITTVAGNGYGGYRGDGDSAIHAELWHPSGIAIDSGNNLYIADYYNYVIRKVSSSGIITTYAGTGFPGYSGDGDTATLAEIYQAFGIAVDKMNNLYIADAGNNRIRKVSPSGIITTVAGNGVVGSSGDGDIATLAELYNPAGVSVDDLGNIYIADQFNQKIRKVDASNIIHTAVGNGIYGFSGDGGIATAAELAYPNEAIIDPSGNILFVCDNENNRIREVTLTNGVNNLFTGDVIKVYPNPAYNAITVVSPQKITSLQLYDIVSKLVIDQAPNTDKININIAFLQKGLYLLKVNGTYTQKIIKE